MKRVATIVGIAALSAAGIAILLAFKTRLRVPGLVGLMQGSKPFLDAGWVERKWLDLPYGPSEMHRLDVYLPNEGSGPFPVILAMHGGSFLMGDKAGGDLNALLEGLKRGYALVSINYRFSDQATFPAQIHDVKAAIRFIRANAAAYRLDPDRIAAWGSSSGGHLAALAGTSGDVKALEDLSLGNPDQSSRVQAVVDWFGPIDFLSMEAPKEDQGSNREMARPAAGKATDPISAKLLGASPSEAPGIARRSNPETYITPDAPPFLIQHGTKDPLVPTQQAVNFAKKLEKVLGRDKVRLILLPGAKHGGPPFDAPENVKQVLDFLDEKLK